MGTSGGAATKGGQSTACCDLQQDGTLGDVLQCQTELKQALAQLCGIGRRKEPDEAVRAALAEAILMLVPPHAAFTKCRRLQYILAYCICIRPSLTGLA